MNYVKTEAELLRDIALKLDAIIGLLAARGIDDADAVIERLNSMKLNAKTIAFATGISENAVNIRLSRMRKKKAAGKA